MHRELRAAFHGGVRERRVRIQALPEHVSVSEFATLAWAFVSNEEDLAMSRTIANA
ncbi:hypothetical protein [Paraburkholderia sp. J7]|uniref:hypothetical protein n=1 Tax=Paraburkholderia sp. J7 TaxID=2805438 RepID=UPI002AB7EABF|nr:hypothetical protein [Paraburkholderia sp. J7]